MLKNLMLHDLIASRKVTLPESGVGSELISGVQLFFSMENT